MVDSAERRRDRTLDDSGREDASGCGCRWLPSFARRRHDAAMTIDGDETRPYTLSV
jgi:hypothetical protein